MLFLIHPVIDFHDVKRKISDHKTKCETCKTKKIFEEFCSSSSKQMLQDSWKTSCMFVSFNPQKGFTGVTRPQKNVEFAYKDENL